MKNRDILSLVERGFLTTTNHTLSAAAGYRFYKFRKAVNKAYLAITESESELLAAAGIDSHPLAFNKRLEDLRVKAERTADEQKELVEMAKKASTYNQMRAEMQNEEVEMPAIILLTYEEWKALQDENSAVEYNGKTVDVLSGPVEELLEGVLWAVPEE